MSDEVGESPPVDGLALAKAVRHQYTRYIAFHSDVYDEEADTLTLWTMHTHAFDAAEVTPYILVHGPTEEGGKSRVPEVAFHLVSRPYKGISPTPAGLFHAIDILRPTLLIDEMDQLHDSKPLQAVLNSGFEPGSPIIRAKQAYNVFCPKMFTGIAGKRLPIRGTTLSRCIQIPIRRHLPNEEPIDEFRRRDVKFDCLPIRQELVWWAEQNLDALLVARPIMEGVVDRTKDCWEPLIAIADVIGGDWPERARKAMVTLTKRRVSEPTPNLGVILDLKRVWEQIEGDRIHGITLAEKLNELEDRMSQVKLGAHELSMVLIRFGIHPEKNPFSIQGKLMRGYKRSSFDDVARRYWR